MGIGYELINRSRREQIIFAHLPVNTRREICGNPVPASIATWYLAACQGDEVQLVSVHGEWPLPHGSREETLAYTDVTDRVIQELIGAEHSGTMDLNGRARTSRTRLTSERSRTFGWIKNPTAPCTRRAKTHARDGRRRAVGPSNLNLNMWARYAVFSRSDVYVIVGQARAASDL
jgi:hypothetical protein